MVARMRILFFHPEMFATLLVLSHLALISRAFRIPCTFLPGHGDILRASSQQGGLHSCVVPASRHKVWRSLRMSESTDDYPSDSGDSRFDAAGERSSSGTIMNDAYQEYGSVYQTAIDYRIGEHETGWELLGDYLALDYAVKLRSDHFETVSLETKRMRGTFSSTESPGIARPKMDLLRLSAITGRGQFATQSERSRIDDAILELEMSTPIEATATDAALEGRWALVYASEDATRSSPFFWAFRKATEQLKVPFGGGEEGGSVAARIFAITDSIPGKSVGEAVQTITAEQIRSEVEIYAGASAGSDAKNNGQGPASFPSFRSVMTTTSDIISTSGMETTLRVAKTQVRKSALGRLLKPIFNLDEVEFPTERLLSPLRQGADEVVMKTTFLDENLRISRNEQGQVFVFVREDDGELR